MSMKSFILGSLVAGAGLAAARYLFAKAAPSKPAADSTTFSAIDACVDEQMHRLKIPGLGLAIVQGDEIVYQRGYGRARPGGEAPTPQTPFFIGSLTKSFTALAVLQLVEAGKIELDAPVQRYLPWFRIADPHASAEITVRHLLNQTSGLSASSGEIPLANFDGSPGAAECQARALSTLALTRPVGLAFEYSNANYNLLGLIIESATGQSYADYVHEYIFTPLGMSHTYTSPAIAKQNGLAVGHQYWFAIPFAVPNMPAPHGSLASGQLISSAEDMAHYMIALLNEGYYDDAQVISAAIINESHRGVADFQAMGLSLGQYGMGWFIDKIGGTKLVWHSGTNPDFAAYMALLPEQKRGVVLLFNASHHWMNPVLSDLGAGVTALLAGQQPSPVPFVGLIPWLLRGQLLIPALQGAGVVATLRLLCRWRLEPERRPSGGRLWGAHILLPLLPNLLPALTLIPMLGKRRGYLSLYMPDYAWIAMVCGSFALLWSFLRTGLVLRTRR
jgi:CubicO group peptidase (beta-lactamase class C family)